MPILKTKWHRSIAVLLCVMLMFSAAFTLAAFADTAVISSTTMYSYFQTYNTSGTWVDLQTPAHWVTATGEVAYCLQTSKDNPYNGGYYTIDGEDVYDDYVLTGLRAILTNGYPANNGGFDDQQARYATANAIRFFLAENYADGMPQYLNLNVNGDWIRGKPGYEDLFDWSLYLLSLAESSTVFTGSAGTLTFNPSQITLTQNGEYFTGTVSLTKGISGDYSLMDNMPEGKIIAGHTGTQSENLTISIPTGYAQQSYTLCAYGFDEAPSARLFFWAPAATNQQRIVTYILDGAENIFVRGFLTVNTPAAVVQPQTGSLQITKTDESGNPLSGVGFTLYDSSRSALSTKTTDSSGVAVFSDLTLGNYYYAETSALPGYVPDSTQYPVTISTAGQTATKTMTNSQAKGSLKIVKTDDQGNPLASTGFSLYDSAGTRIKSGFTDSSGVLIFADLPLGDYTYQESFALPGYALDDTQYPISITENGQVITKTVTNSKSAGTIKILKTDSETGQPLQGAEFTLMNATYQTVATGVSDESGLVTFSGLTLGYYYIQETNAPPGYVPYGHIDQVLLDANGKVISKTYENTPARGTIKIVKKNGDGEFLADVVFTLYDAEKNELTTGTTDANGVVTFEGLLVGDYFYSETSELPGYIPNHALQSARVGYHGCVEEITVTNYAAHGHLRGIKTDEAGSPLAGVHFKLTDEAGNLINEGDTDNNGKILFTMLPVGKYILKETATLTGYVLDDTPIPFELTQDGQVVTKNITNAKSTGSISILKTDADSGAALAGAHFKLTNSSGTVIKEGDTGTDGKLTLTGIPLGTYTLTETAAPTGYVLSTSPITVEVTSAGQTVSKTVTNPRAVGSISILKTDAETSRPLSGAHFKLTNSGRTVIKEGDTGADGKLTLTEIPLGTYTLTETTAPTGFILSSAPITVEITSAGQTVNKTVTNTRAVGNISILKTDAETNAPLAGVRFKLLDSTGALISEAVTGADGTISFSGMALGSYTLQETETKPGYVLNSDPIPITINENGQTVEISVTNTRSSGTLRLVKKDAYGNTPLAGAGYRLLDEAGNKLAEGTTDANGEIVFENLPYGNYQVQEFSAPKGYKLDERCYPVSVNAENVSETKTNLRRSGTLEVKKQDEKGRPLAGAAFLLEYSTDNGTTWTPVQSRNGENITAGGCLSSSLVDGQLTTDSTGSVSFTGLRADSAILYRLTETQAPEGYSLIGAALYTGTLPVETDNSNVEDSETVDGKTYCYTLYVTAADDPTYRLPETGGSGFGWLPLFIPIFALPLIIYLKRKEDCES